MLLKWLLHGIRSNNEEIIEDATQLLSDLAQLVSEQEEMRA